MAIFGRDETPDAAPTAQPSTPTARPSQPAAKATQISPGTAIQGEVSGKTAVQIDGVVDGRILVEGRVVVGAQGKVKGEIHAQQVEVAGKVTGNILGDEKVDIHSSGKLHGDVKAPRVSIADGAYFKGRVEMVTEGAAPAPERPAKAPAKPAVPPKLDPVKVGESPK